MNFHDPNAPTPGFTQLREPNVNGLALMFVAPEAMAAKAGTGVLSKCKNLLSKLFRRKPSKVDNLLTQIEQSGAKVKLNPKTASQEGNVTLDFGKEGRINIRVETHPLEQNGPLVRHGNVDVIKQVGGKNTVRKIHITE